MSAEAAASGPGRGPWLVGHILGPRLYHAALTVVGPAEEAGQRQDVIRRALMAGLLLVVVPFQRHHLPGWETIVAALIAALAYDAFFAYLVFVRRQIFLQRFLAFVFDALLLSLALIFVLRGLGRAGSDSDLWLAVLAFVVSGGFVLAPLGSLTYTALATASFILGTHLYFPPDSQYAQQLVMRVVFFIVFGLMSLGIAQELESRRQNLLRQNRLLFESKAALESKSADLERSLAAERERGRRDALTGVLNHAAIVDELRSHISGSRRAGAKPLTVAMVDVDGLKAINDTFGHQMGDMVLTTVASALGRPGAVVGRYGGDEFVVVLPGTDRAAAERYSEEVLSTLAQVPLRDQSGTVRIPLEVSLGIAFYPEEAETIEDLIRLSDSAMYSSRRQRFRDGINNLGTPAGEARAAAIVGELVPLLTAPGTLESKLGLVAQRLSLAAGYDSVDIVLGQPHGPPLMQSTFADADDALVDAWMATQREPKDERPIFASLQQTGRPMLLTAVQDDERLSESERAVLRAAGITSAVIAPMYWQGQMIGTLSIGRKAAPAFGPRDAQFLMAVAGQVTAIVGMAKIVEQLEATSGSLRAAQTETVLLLAAAAEAHDYTTGIHLHGIRATTEALAAELGYSDEDAEALGLAAVLHDIGKIRVPDDILANPSHLSDREWETMKQHTLWSAEFLAGRPGFELAAVIARNHHERWDGSGYPDGLAREAIPEAASIVAVADSYDAMINDRPYRTARTITEAVVEIAASARSQFNPRVVDALVRLHKRGQLHRMQMELSLEDTA